MFFLEGESVAASALATVNVVGTADVTDSAPLNVKVAADSGKHT